MQSVVYYVTIVSIKFKRILGGWCLVLLYCVNWHTSHISFINYTSFKFSVLVISLNEIQFCGKRVFSTRNVRIRHIPIHASSFLTFYVINLSKKECHYHQKHSYKILSCYHQRLQVTHQETIFLFFSRGPFLCTYKRNT